MPEDKPNDATADVCECGAEASEEELLARLDRMLDDYVGKPGSLIPVLQQAQAIFGYLPDMARERISERLGIPASRVFGVITFYSFFSMVPRGKHLIRVCLGTACYVLNASKVLDALKTELHVDVGETTEDRLFSLEVGRCFGACGLAPVITIDEDVHKRVKPAEVEKILALYRNGGNADEQGDQ